MKYARGVHHIYTKYLCILYIYSNELHINLRSRSQALSKSLVQCSCYLFGVYLRLMYEFLKDAVLLVRFSVVG